MLKIGDKVIFGSNHPMIGYIVGINIDPNKESDVNFNKNNWVDYTIRVFKPFYKGGYTDFQRSRDEIALY